MTMKRQGAKLLLIGLILAGCSTKMKKELAPAKDDRLLASAWDSRNIPENIIIDQVVRASKFDRKFESLPRSGQLDFLPWTGDYWASYRGGISYRWNDSISEMDDKSRYDYTPGDAPDGDVNKLSPAEKWDLFVGDSKFSLTLSERRRVGLGGREIPRWEGLCHAWAPATVLYKNPKPVTVKAADGRKINFGSSDIKALLTYFVHWAPRRGNNRRFTSFLGSRCETTLKDLRDSYSKWSLLRNLNGYHKYLKGACGDTNAGSFHLVLTNMIGKRKKSFIMDVTRTQEVWNQAVYKYESTVLKEKAGSSDGAAEGTVKEIDILSKVWYVAEPTKPFSQDGFKNLQGEDIYTENSAMNEKWYFYRVELDKDNNIIGGEWLDPQNYGEYFDGGLTAENDRYFEDRPDFLWDSTAPDFFGRFARLKEIYEKSVGKMSGPSDANPSDPRDGMERGFLRITNAFFKSGRVNFAGSVSNNNATGVRVLRHTWFGRKWRIVANTNIDENKEFAVDFKLGKWKRKNTGKINIQLFRDNNGQIEVIDSRTYSGEELAQLLK